MGNIMIRTELKSYGDLNSGLFMIYVYFFYSRFIINVFNDDKLSKVPINLDKPLN